MSGAMSISLTGLLAAGVRLDAAASNIANMNSTGSLAGAATSKTAYNPVRVEQTALASGENGQGGTEARLRPVMPAYVPSYEPDTTYADANGMVAAPNVDPLQEMMSVEEAAFAYRMNLAVMKTAAEMVRSLYDDIKHD